jgi:hypothetical protein
MIIAFSEAEYARVRDWLMSALLRVPGVFDEAELLEKLRAGEYWFLVTTEHSAGVLELVRIDGELIANVLLVGGERGKALREILAAIRQLRVFLASNGFVKMVGTPRKEFHNILKANGFEEEQEELVTRL